MKNKKQYKKCHYCGNRKKDVRKRACGYQKEINEKIVMETICDDCEQEHSWDI